MKKTLVASVQTFALTVSLALLTPSAFAQAFDSVRLFGAAPGKDGGRAGLAVIAGQAYQGSDASRTMAVPLIEYRWANGWFAGSTNGIGYNFSDRQDMQYGARLTADFGRKENRSQALSGMGDIDAKAEFGGFFNYLLSREVSLNTSLRYGSGQDRNGLLADLVLGYSTELSSALRLGLGVAATLANADYMQSYFGVTAAQSVNSGYATYKPGAGLRDVRVNLSLTYRITPEISATAGVSASTLSGDASDSPLVRQKSTTTGLLAVAYSF
ncbi:MAG: MipA/OmpV family protein [Rhodoferax sp.]|nr:MipA/OmpV family protein [Rhodoferax sp.]